MHAGQDIDPEAGQPGPLVNGSTAPATVPPEAPADVGNGVDEKHTEAIPVVVGEIAAKTAAISESKEPAEEEKANIISRIIYGYATHLFIEAWRRRRAYKKKDRERILAESAQTLDKDEFAKLERRVHGELEFEDFWKLPKGDDSERIAQLFEKRYNSYVKKPNESSTNRLTSAMIAVVWKPMAVAAVIKVLNTALQFSYPFFLRYLLESLQPAFSGKPITDGYFWAIGLGAAMLMKALTENAYFWHSMRSGWQLRQALSSAVYRKSLRLSTAARQSKTLGEIVNLMQLDATKIELFMAQAHSVWDGIIQIIGYTMIIFWVIGWSSFIGLAFMLTMIPLMGMVMKKLMTIDRLAVKVTDERVKKVNEAIQGILGLKMAAWEEPLAKVLGGVRANEVRHLSSAIWFRSFSSAYMMSAPALTAAIAISVYATVQDGGISASTLFTALNTFGQLRFPLMLYPMALAQYAQATVSRKRLADFLDMEEVKFEAKPIDSKASDECMKLENITVYWADPTKPQAAEAAAREAQKRQAAKKTVSKSSQPQVNSTPNEQKSVGPALENINLSVKRGELVAIVGGVGQGKTALVNTMLREMYLHSGTLHIIPEPIAFASQTPWILNATVRDNIVFGTPFDEEWYNRVLDACQLRADLSMLEEYDLTSIGERGVNLSGGQKQRVAMARAAYNARNAGIVIADDPLSALDPEVSARLFEQCFLELLDGYTRIVVSNNLDVLKECDKIVFIQGGEGAPGRIVEQGTFEDLMADSNSNLAMLMSRHRGEQSRTPTPTPEQATDAPQEKKLRPKTSKSPGFVSSNALLDPRNKKPDDAKKNAKILFTGQSTSIIKAEERARGAVSGSMYATYIKAGGGWLVFFLVYLLFIVSQGANWLSTYWITLWSNDALPNGTYKTQSLTFYLVGYALTAIVMAIAAFFRTSALLLMGLRASTTLHNQLLRSVLHARMYFFDTTPTGRVLQRFSQDIRALDVETSEQASFFLFTTLFVLVSIGTIIGVTPIFAVFLLPFGILYFGALAFYRPVMRDAKRLSSIMTSPVYAHFSETLGGVVSVRAFKRLRMFSDKNVELLNSMTKMSMALKLCERWLSVRLEIIGTLICLVSALFCVQAVDKGLISAGDAGLSLSFSMSTTFLLTSTIRSFTALEAGMNSVERVHHMGTMVPQEKWRDEDYEKDEFIKPDESWPPGGEIVVQDLRMRYREDTPLVLKGLSFHIRAGEKIGVAGRTGSGKSSLFLALLRIVEPLPGSKIQIDGVDVTKMSLVNLRSNISIAPQLPVLFSGTLRYNLDPFDVQSDADIWDAIDKVGMKGAVQALPEGLLAPVSEYGENFSQGERQLISLARALLAKPKILLLDESTASLDADRDQLIQTTIAENFRNATMIVIAHRLDTIVRSDRILVLGDGSVLEFDAPSVLLANPQSHLSLAVEEMGSGQAERMRKKATEGRHDA